MQVQVKTDNNLDASAAWQQEIQGLVEGTLERFGSRITRVDVYLADESSSQKDTSNDKRCTLEARLAGLQPVSVRNDGDTFDQALDGALDKLVKTLNRMIERRDDPKGRTSFAGDQS